MQVSVVIPTHNRAEILKCCIGALFEQKGIVNGEFEVVVVDDGSRDETKETVEGLMKDAPANLRYFYQKNQGQGVARNTGVAHADGKIIIFIGDDIFVQSDFVAEHVRMHHRHPGGNEAVLGLTLWHPEIRVNSFMEFLTNGSQVLGRFGGHQFAYEKLEGKKMADFNFFYTSNISLKRSLLLKFPFDTDFSAYGWEDIELGYRLQKDAGLKLYYHKEAMGYHYHELTIDSLAPRMRAIGRAAHLIHRKYPELQKVPSAWKQYVFQVLGSGPIIQSFDFLKKFSGRKLSPYYYYALSKRYFMEGLIEGAKDVKTEV